MGDKYNGWATYETWAVALWLDNEEGSYEEARSIVARHEIEDGSAAQALKEWLDATMPDLGSTLWSDLLRASFGEVHWQEIAEHYKDDDTEDNE